MDVNVPVTAVIVSERPRWEAESALCVRRIVTEPFDPGVKLISLLE